MKNKIAVFTILFLVGVILSSAFLIQRVFAQSSDLEIIIGSGGNADGDFKFYCQSNYSNKYDSGTIASSGCGPSSVAMVLATYGLKAKQSDANIANPVTVSRLFEEKGIAWFPGNRSCTGGIDCVGSSPRKMTEPSFLSSVGLKRAQMDIMGEYTVDGKPLTHTDIMQIRSFTNAGWYILASTKNWIGCNSCAHTFVIVDADPATDKIITASPSDCYEQGNGWKFSTTIPALNRKGTTFMSLVPVKLK